MIRHALATASGADVQPLRFHVDGVPRPQGSLKAFAVRRDDGATVTRLKSDNANLDAWRQDVAWSAKTALGPGIVPYSGAVEVVAVFVLARPRGRREFPTTRPDVDKLARGILDALTGVVWRDDSQVIGLIAAKRYAKPGEDVGADVSVKPARFGL